MWLLQWSVEDIRKIQSTLPKTHEVGGHLEVDGAGRVQETILFEGTQCRNHEGNRLRATTQCRIHKPDARVSFHTHPKSNRPSSADLRNAVLKHPRISRRGQRRLSLVITRAGLWWYLPSRAMQQEWKHQLKARNAGFVKGHMRAWSQEGHRIINRHQEDPQAFCRFMRARGMHIHYLPRHRLPPQGWLQIAKNGDPQVVASLPG